MGADGPITFQPTDHDINISSTGIISVRDGSGTISAQRGQLQIAGFDHPQQLQKDGGSMFLAPARVIAGTGAAEYPHRARRAREIERQPQSWRWRA